MTMWEKNEDDTERTCRYCKLKVTATEWEQVMLTGTSSFPQCTGECVPQGVLEIQIKEVV